ncbi:MAG: 1,4-alpha-glucan branching enzyme, partial [Lachnospiraceae bacterium]|nr:1,4-alpha-glucan branching enzyme [Lachnospiraceae bacterium]
SPEDFMYFVEYMHTQGIGVILAWVPAHFPRDTFGLSNFDGTCLYEHQDPRKGSHPHWGTLIFNYGRPEVSNFLIANALFWLKKYHVDGIRMDAVASMLYLDYGKNDGEWVANMYGGNENLEAIELLKHLNSIAKKQVPGALMIAEESTAWPKITGDLDDEGLGFDFKWNMGWMNDFTTYMRQDPLFRRGCHGSLTFSMIYAYSENFILVLSHDEVVHGKGSMLGKMPGTYEEKFANLRVAYGFMMCHPGKKLLFMGQDMAQLAEWNEEKSLEWHLLTDKVEGDASGTLNAKIHNMVKDLNALYVSHPALYQLDQDPDGFEWMSCLDADHSIVTFVRKTDNLAESLFVVCNFTPVVYEKQSLGVPFAGKYKEIFNSDAVCYGGSGNTNPRLKQSKEERVDGRDNSIQITIPPLGCAIFTCTPIRKEKN